MKRKDIIYLSVIALLAVTLFILVLRNDERSAEPKNDETSAKTLFADGLKLYNSDKQEQALIKFSECIELDAEFADAYEYRGRCYLYFAPVNSETYEKYLLAYEDFKQAIKMDPSKDELRKLMADSLVSYISLSLQWSNRPVGVEEFREAFELASKAIDAAPDYYLPYWKRAWLINTTALELGIEDMKKAITLGKRNGSDYDVLARLYSADGDYSGYVKYLEQETQKHETDYSLWLLLAEGYRRDKNFEDVEEALGKALKHCPQDERNRINNMIMELKQEKSDK